jgi:UDP-N-acetylglucosamine 2-epimerase (non-hydrolysing)
MELAVILGTRPEIIKLSPIIRILEREALDYFILHTGQHYSYSMDRIFFEQLELPKPKYSLNVGSGTHAEQTGRMLIGIEKVLAEEKPSLVLTQGDTNTTLAGALAAVKLNMPVGHVEAGLRSFDWSMPEEINRVLTDRVSSLLFAPTDKAKVNLLREGISDDRVFVTGNTVVDAIYQNLNLVDGNGILDNLDVDGGEYFLVTIHRQENADNIVRFRGILEGLRLIYRHYGLPIIYPIHPRAAKKICEFKLKPDGVTLIDPVDYISFLKLEKEARMILTDSGGVQEEACILHVPCVTLRDNTERPETLEVGANMLAGADPKSILEKVGIMLERSRDWANPFGDGRAGERIVKIFINRIMNNTNFEL